MKVLMINGSPHTDGCTNAALGVIAGTLAEQGIDSDEDIEALIRGTMEEFDVHLSDEDVAKLVELMDKVSKLDIDVNALAQQASQLYEKLKGMGLDLDNIDTEQVGNFITRFFDRIVDLISSLFE